MLSGEIAAPDDVKYRFGFLDPASATFPWIKFKDLVFASYKRREMLEILRNSANRDLTIGEEDKLTDHLDIIDRTFKMDETITYQELDSIDTPGLYTEDDVVEVFIRANSGGTKLGKSDLLFSLLSASWSVADEQMEVLLEMINRHGFAFDRDFVLKTCLVLLDQGARYEVAKFRKKGVREDIEEKWREISNSIKAVLDYIRSKTFIQCDKALPSHLVLMPLIYLHYKQPVAWKTAKEVDYYLLRCLITGAFSGQSDRLIDSLKKKLDETTKFSVDDMFDVIRFQNRSLELTEDRFWQMGYGSSTIHLLFNVWYRDFAHIPAYENNLPQIDHIFPQSKLREIKITNPDTGRLVMKYRDRERNQLANCMLLTREENGSGGKSDILPEVWFADKEKNYLEKHLIPQDKNLWGIENFDDFIAARKDLIRNKFKSLLVQE